LRLPVKLHYNGEKYTVLEFLGSGAGGSAYRAQDTTGKDVVVKFVSKFKVDNWYELFKREMEGLKITNRLIHADTNNKILIYKMIPGITFAKYLQQVLQNYYSGSGVSASEKKDLLEKVHLYFSALKEFNDKYGLLHGDVRPLNTIIMPDGKMELIDFGLSEISPLDQDEFAKRFRYQSDMSKLELYYWVSVNLPKVKDTTRDEDYRHLWIIRATPGREVQAEEFCQNYQKKYNLPTDTCQKIEKQYQDLRNKVKELVSQSEPDVEELKELARKLRKRFMFTEEGEIDCKLSSLI